MKNIIVFISTITLIFCFESCIKTSCGEDKNISSSIIGTWELRKTTAAMNPIGMTYPAGNGNILKFNNDNYEVYKNKQLVKTGKYIIVIDSTVEKSVCLEFTPDRYTNRVVYDGNFNEPKEFFEISNDQLTFISGCYAVDAGHTSTYER